MSSIFVKVTSHLLASRLQQQKAPSTIIRINQDKFENASFSLRSLFTENGAGFSKMVSSVENLKAKVCSVP